jgi:hypothetical protein
MKYNANGSTHNMANVFGPEFNLNNEEIINTIKKIFKLEVIDLTFNPLDVEVAFYNNDYYIRPGIAKDCFMMKCGKAFKELKAQQGKMDDNLLHFSYLIQVYGIIKEFFDEAYFEEQVRRRSQAATRTVNKDKLRMYLKKLDKDGLEMFLSMVVTCRRQRGMFITDVSSAGFWEKIHESCRAAGVNVPHELDSVEGQKFLNSNPNVYFQVLSTKVIANMLCDAIDIDIEVAASAAKKLYKSGYNAMINYIRLAQS